MLLESAAADALITAACTINGVLNQALLDKINGSTNKPQSYNAAVWGNMSEELKAPFIAEAAAKTAGNRAEYERALAAGEVDESGKAITEVPAEVSNAGASAVPA